MLMEKLMLITVTKIDHPLNIHIVRFRRLLPRTRPRYITFPVRQQSCSHAKELNLLGSYIGHEALSGLLRTCRELDRFQYNFGSPYDDGDDPKFKLDRITKLVQTTKEHE